MYAWRTLGSNGYYRNVHITLVFIPTARGTVETIGAGPILGALPPETDFAIDETGDSYIVDDGFGSESDVGAQTVTVPRTVLDDIVARIERLESQDK